MHVIAARCLQTQSILNRLTIEQWSTIEKSPFSVKDIKSPPDDLVVFLTASEV